MSDTCLTVYAHMFVETLIPSTHSSFCLSFITAFFLFNYFTEVVFWTPATAIKDLSNFSLEKERLKKLIRSEMSKEIEGKKDRKRESDH